jgi:DNA-directed RNA polymerase specialized sigma24 family protein
VSDAYNPAVVSPLSKPQDAGPAEEAPKAGEPSTAEAKLTALVHDYGRLIALAIRRVVGPAGVPEASDIEQQVHIALWQQLRREQSIEYPASYVYKAAIREAVRAVRRYRARAEEPLELAPLQMSGPETRADRLTDARRVQDAVGEALGTMAPDRARAVRGHLAGFNVEELMTLYGWTYQRARNLIARGMADLRDELRTRGLP